MESNRKSLHQTQGDSTLALAWAYAYSRHDTERLGINTEPPEDDTEDTPAAKLGGGRPRSRPRGRKSQRPRPKPKPPDRQLVDLEDIDLTEIQGLFMDGPRKGTMKFAQHRKVREPKPGQSRRSAAPRPAGRAYTDRDREDLAYALIADILADTDGLTLDDVRDQPNVGADAVDHKRDIWVELKAHGRDLDDNLKLEPSEAERAHEKRGNYWLVVVWDLEAPRTPKYAVVPDPLHRLDTYLKRGMALTGLQKLITGRSDS